MDLTHELHIMRTDGVTKIKDLDLTAYLQGLQKLEDDTATKEEVQDLYLLGFTSGELLGLSSAYNSRQALFSVLSKKHANYKDINREKRQEVEDHLTYYYGYVLVEQGDVTEANRIFGDNQTRMIKYYISQGGEKDLWTERTYSQGMYVNILPFLKSDKSIRQVIDELSAKPEIERTYDEQYFLDMDEAQYNSLQACYGRIKKIEVMNAIYQNKTYDEILEEHFVLDKTYNTYYNNAIKQVKKLYNKYQGEANIVQLIKYHLRVTGKGANEFIEGVIDELAA